jgi:hypothetical protein
LTVGFGRCSITDGWKHPREGKKFPEYTVHDELYATAFVVAAHGHALAAFVSLDMGVITRPHADEIRRLVSRKTRIPVEHILLHCTHTHASYPGYIVDPEVLAGWITQAIREAIAAARRADIAHACREIGTGFNFNRRVRLSDGLGAWCVMFNTDCRTEGGRVEVSGRLRKEVQNWGARWEDLEMSRREIWTELPVDSHLHVVSFQDDARRTLGSIVRFAGHPVIVSQQWIGSEISRDAVGYVADVVAEKTGAPCLYLTGPSGDLRLYCEDYSHVEARKRGRLIGDQAVKLLAELRFAPFDRFALACDEPAFDLWPGFPASPVEQRRKSAELESGLKAALAEGRKPAEIKKLSEDRARMEFVKQMLDHVLLIPEEAAAGRFRQPLWVVELGAAAFVTFPFEPFEEASRTLRTRMGENVITVELVGGAQGYVPTAEEWSLGGYETTWCSTAPDTADKLIETAVQLMRHVQPGQRGAR